MREMKRSSLFIFLMFILLRIEAQAQSYSILTGIVTEFHGKVLVVKSEEGGVIQLRVGWRTVYPNRIPAVGDKVKVEYSILRGVYVGYSVAILEGTRKEIELQKMVMEKPPPLPSNLSPKISDFDGKWEGFWDGIKNYGFTLTIRAINLELEVAEVRYESKDLQFSKKANVIPGEKPKIEWVINSLVNPASPFASKVTVGSKEYYAILTESIPIYYTVEIQKDGTLKGTFDSQRLSPLGTSRMAVLRRVD
jgi:hypothetical protein